ncbi:MAG: Hsp70 family protein [Pseudomonadota bacterium]|nr:Hsp70 family protein [Pseudomonadota bacterium]
MKETIIGIDLGTTNSEVAIVVDGSVEVIKIDDREQLPSVVGIGEEGGLLVGTPARNQYVLYPERTVRSIKREMGKESSFHLGERDYTPQEISAMILRRLKQAAEAYLGATVTRAVITVPAYFSDAQRQATRDAGAIAGLEVVRIINEPTAAALTYESGHEGNKRILVYDLGGGTFDVSVVNMDGDVVEVVAGHGNNQLGGDDFDDRIVAYIVAHIQSENDIDAQQSSQAMARIQRAAETAKITLSSNPYALIEEEYLLEQDGAPVHLSLELSRDDYEKMIAPFVDETLDAIHIALKGAKLAVSDLDEILLVGGSTRTPIIAERLESTLNLQPRSELNPDLCVASGAAIQAAVISGEKTSGVLVDITPYTFGTSAYGVLDGVENPEVYVPVIRKNSVIPTTRSEVFFTMVDYQKKVDVKVFQGEARDALENILIGEFRVEGLSDVPSGNPVIISFSLDLDGILHVTAKEKSTGLEKSITIDNAMSSFDETEMKAARMHIGEMFDGEILEEEETQDQQSEVTQARALIEKARNMLDDATADDREDLVDLVESLDRAIEDDDKAALLDASEELTDLIFYLES